VDHNGQGQRAGERELREADQPGNRYAPPGSGHRAGPARLLTVTEIVVFGSYLDPAVDPLGDLDLA